MLKHSIVFLFCAATGPLAIAGDGNSTVARPASLLQDERAEAARALVLAAHESRVRIDLNDVLPGGAEQPSSGVPLTLILPDLSTKQAVTNAEGIAEFEGVAPGQVVGVTTTTGDGRHVAVGASTVAANAPGEATTLIPYRAPHEELLRMAEGHARVPGEAAPEELQAVGVEQALATDYYRVLLSPEGSIVGQVHTLVPAASREYDLANVNIAVMRDEQVIRSTVTDSSGRFVIEDLAPGFYGIFAAGRAGYAAFGFYAIGAEPLPPIAGSAEVKIETVSLRQPATSSTLHVTLVPPQMVPVVIEQIVAAGGLPFAAAAPMGAPLPVPGFPGFGGPGMGGGFGGGGGGLAGGAGIGTLGLIGAGIAAAALAADDDDDDDFFVPPVLSPNGQSVLE